MSISHPLAGIYAAAITPLRDDFSPDIQQIPRLLDFFAGRGCHGALLLGTTGEGPSFAPAERRQIFAAAAAVRQSHPDFKLLAGTGTPSLQETIELTQVAFEEGMDAVVVLPPYYFRNASDEGLFAWFSQVLQKAVPEDGGLLGYHIPPVSGVPLSFDLLVRLKEAYPSRFLGLKDSSANPEHAALLGERFGDDLLVLNGNDRLLSWAMNQHASGGITAMANLTSPYLRQVWEAYQQGKTDDSSQAYLNAARTVMDHYPSAPPLLKALMAEFYGFPRWAVRPPLMPLSDDLIAQAAQEMAAIG